MLSTGSPPSLRPPKKAPSRAGTLGVEGMKPEILEEALRRAGLSVRVRAYSSSLDTLLALCERSVGACFCSDMLLHALRTDRQLENMLVLKFPNLTDQQIRFAYMKKNYQLNMLSEFMRIARETVKPLV